MTNLKILNDNFIGETTCLGKSSNINYFLQGDTGISGKLWINSCTSKIILLEGQRLIFEEGAKIGASKKTKLIIEGRQVVNEPSSEPVNAFINNNGALFKNIIIETVNLY